jgi:hypothetical protein
VVEVRPNFFRIADAGANLGVQVGADGLVIADAGSAASAAAVVAAIKHISPKPIRYVPGACELPDQVDSAPVEFYLYREVPAQAVATARRIVNARDSTSAASNTSRRQTAGASSTTSMQIPSCARR